MNMVNPFVGLRPFEMDESLLFFGRQKQTTELLLRLNHYHFVAVVGSSGCGKSSLIRAGLIPSLKGGYLVNDQDHWKILIMKPGKSPLYNLSHAVNMEVHGHRDPEEVKCLAADLRVQGACALLHELEPHAGKEANFLLLVDQFEELFRFAELRPDTAEKEEATEFVNLLLELTTQREIPVYVVITMRSDFIGDCNSFYGLPEAINKSQYLVPRLNRVQVRQTIEGPLKLYGLSINSALTARLLNDIQKTKDELPLLQHVLMRMCSLQADAQRVGELELADYLAAGELEGALSRHANEALTGLLPSDEVLIKKIFQALTAVDENGRKVRRPVRLSQLIHLTGTDSEKILALIHLLIDNNRSFLIIAHENEVDPVVDISHESLIRQWNILNGWVDEEVENSNTLIRLVEAAKLYRDGHKDLLSGTELSSLWEWYPPANPLLPWAARYSPDAANAFSFLEDSQRNYDRQQQLVRRRKILIARRLRALYFAAVAAIIFIFFTYISIKDREQLESKRQVFVTNSDKAYRKHNLLEAYLFAVAAQSLRSTDSLQNFCMRYFPLYTQQEILSFRDQLDSVKFDPDPAIVRVFDDNVEYRWDIQNETPIDTTRIPPLPGNSTYGYKAQVQQLLKTWGIDLNGTTRIFDTSDGLRTIPTDYPKDLGIIYGITFSPDNRRILTWGLLADSLWGATVWDAATGLRLGNSLVHTSYIYHGVFSTDYRRILTLGEDSTMHYWVQSPAALYSRPDKDLPPDLLKLQAQVITGATIDYSTNETTSIPIAKWRELQRQWQLQARAHFNKCRYPEGNYWNLVYGPAKR